MTFNYPSVRTERRHGPNGYSAYQLYRPWLRDEFLFRCVYCLKREKWGQVTGDFELDHFAPQSLHPERSLDFVNLVYACRRCNAVKLDQSIDDPWILLTSEHVQLLQDGEIRSTHGPTLRLILQLDLNAPKMIEWRVMWMRVVELAAEKDSRLYVQLTGFPDDLPNLAKLRPPGNSRPDGVSECWYALRQSGLLPETY